MTAVSSKVLYIKCMDKHKCFGIDSPGRRLTLVMFAHCATNLHVLSLHDPGFLGI